MPPLTAPVRTYLRRHLFSEVHDYIYTRRILSNGKVRCGLIGVIDLEQYEFNPGSRTTVRATEGVIQNLIEPTRTSAMSLRSRCPTPCC